MMDWRFDLTKEAESDLEKLDFSIQARVIEKIKWFRENFDQITPLPLGGNWRGFFKLRIGDYRVIYEVERERRIATIHYIDRRDKIYHRGTPKE